MLSGTLNKVWKFNTLPWTTAQCRAQGKLHMLETDDMNTFSSHGLRMPINVAFLHINHHVLFFDRNSASRRDLLNNAAQSGIAPRGQRRSGTGSIVESSPLSGNSTWQTRTKCHSCLGPAPWLPTLRPWLSSSPDGCTPSAEATTTIKKSGRSSPVGLKVMPLAPWRASSPCMSTSTMSTLSGLETMSKSDFGSHTTRLILTCNRTTVGWKMPYSLASDSLGKTRKVCSALFHLDHSLAVSAGMFWAPNWTLGLTLTLHWTSPSGDQKSTPWQG